MFREMRRFKQKISDEDCFKILTEQRSGAPLKQFEGVLFY